MARVLHTPPPTENDMTVDYMARLIEELDYQLGEIKKELRALQAAQESEGQQ